MAVEDVADISDIYNVGLEKAGEVEDIVSGNETLEYGEKAIYHLIR